MRQIGQTGRNADRELRWPEGQQGSRREAERREEGLEDREEQGEGDELQDDVGDVIQFGAVRSLQAGNQVTEHDLRKADTFTAPVAWPPPRGNQAH